VVAAKEDEELIELVQRAKRRDAAAFAVLIRRCQRTALAVAYAQLGDGARAGDAVQDAFLKAWQKLETLDEPGRFDAWLCHIVRNVAVDQRRRWMKPVERAELATVPDVRPASDPAAGLDDAERRQQISAALASLDEVSRSAVVLRYYENLSSRQIGDLLGISAAAVDMRLSRARQELRPLLARMIEGEATSIG
jgi:RNA polymerase sigma-70 factor (ECF subfamily)